MEQLFRRILLPLKYLLLALSYLFLRNKYIWCFGSSFNGNSKYLFIYMSEQLRSKYRCIWIGDSENVELVHSLGFEAYTTWSFKGLYYSLVGGVYVYNSYPANINLYTMGGAKLVNLWHGVALKCIDRQIKDGPMAKFYHATGLFNEIKYLNFRKHPDVVLSTSPIMTENFAEAFDVPNEKIIEGIYPRCCMFDKTEEEVGLFINKYEREQTRELVETTQRFDYTYIYMPTWRDTGDDFLTNCGFDFDVLNETMNKLNRLFLLKLHPDSRLNYDSKYSNIVFIDKSVDIYPLLPYTNCLITDFSSIYFDYLLLKNKQIILFIPDYDEYITNNRALKYPYDEVMKGRKIDNFVSLIESMIEEPLDFDIPGINQIRDRFWAPKYNNMAELVSGIESIMMK